MGFSIINQPLLIPPFLETSTCLDDSHGAHEVPSSDFRRSCPTAPQLRPRPLGCHRNIPGPSSSKSHENWGSLVLKKNDVFEPSLSYFYGSLEGLSMVRFD